MKQINMNKYGNISKVMETFIREEIKETEKGISNNAMWIARTEDEEETLMFQENIDLLMEWQDILEDALKTGIFRYENEDHEIWLFNFLIDCTLKIRKEDIEALEKLIKDV